MISVYLRPFNRSCDLELFNGILHCSSFYGLCYTWIQVTDNDMCCFVHILSIFSGAFLIPYVFMMIFTGFPLMFLELSFGQYGRLGIVSIWRKACPLFEGMLSYSGAAVDILSTNFICSVSYPPQQGWGPWVHRCHLVLYHIVTKENEKLSGRNMSTGCPQPMDY